MHHARIGAGVVFVLSLSTWASGQTPPPPARPIAPGAVPVRPAPAVAPAPLPAKGTTFSGKVSGLPAQLAQSPSPAFVLPNLAVIALTSNSQCEIKVMVKNQGAELQGSEDVTYWLKRESPATGDMPAKIPIAQLRAPGSVATVTFPGMNTAYDRATNFTASVQSNVRDHRVGAAGTTVTNSLKCGPTAAKLDMSIGFEADCDKVVMVRNVGGDLPATNDVSFSVSRTSDGWKHSNLTSGNVGSNGLKTGATMQLVDGVRTYDNFSYSVSSRYASGGETITQAVPDRCRGAKPDYQIDLVEVVANSDCKVAVSIKNKGTVPVPSSLQIPIELRRDTANPVTVFPYSAMGMPPGGGMTAVSNLVLGIPMADISVTLKLPSGDLGPKKFPLNCKK